MQRLQTIQSLQTLVRGGVTSIFDPSQLDSTIQWIFNEDNTVTQAVDKIGTRLGTVFAGRCYDFDGTDDFVNISDSLPDTNLLLGTGVSFSCWAKTEGGTGARMLFSHRDDTNPLLQLSLHDTNGVTAQFRTSTSGIVTTTDTSPTQTNWNHYAVVWNFNTETQKLYVNGVEVQSDSITVSGTLTSAKTILGAFTSNGSTYGGHMNGKFYGALVKNAVLSDEDITNLYNHKLPNSYAAFYKADEGDSTTAFDSSGNENHGTITNATLDTFHATDAGVAYSWLNQAGYTAGEQVIPPESAFFETDGTSYWNPVRSVISYNSIDKHLTFTATGLVPGMYETNILTAGNTYRVKFKAKGNQASGGWKSIGDNNDLGVVISNPDITTDWQDYEFNITPTGTLLRMYQNGISTDVIDVDDIWVIDLNNTDAAIPRDESNRTKSVIGDDLQHAGLVKLNADFVESNCGTFDGVNDEVAFSTTTVTGVFEIRVGLKPTIGSTQVPVGGTSTDYIDITSAGLLRVRVDGTFYITTQTLVSVTEYEIVWSRDAANLMTMTVNGVEVLSQTVSGSLSFSSLGKRNGTVQYYTGSIWNFKIIDNGTTVLHFPFSEGLGTVIHDVSGNDNHGTATNITESTFWGSTQDVYHANITDGFSEGVNQLSYSEQFNESSYWISPRSSVSADVITAPDGTLTADKLIEDGTLASSHYLRRSAIPVIGSSAVLSVYAKAGERDSVALAFNHGGGTQQAIFNLSTGTVTSTGGSLDDSGIEFVSDGWYRCWIYQASVISAFCDILLSNGSTTIYDGDNTSGAYLWGVQLEEGSTATDYQKALLSPTAGVKLPYQINGAYTNPAGAWHNNAETKLKAPETPSLLKKFVHGGTFDGTSNRVSFGSHTGKNLTKATIWCKPNVAITASTAAVRLLGFQDGGGNEGCLAFGSITGVTANEIISVFSGTGSRDAYTSASDSISAEWHKIVMEWNVSKYDIYLDDVLVSNVSSGTPAIIPMQNLTVGGSSSGSQKFAGTISAFELVDDAGDVFQSTAITDGSGSSISSEIGNAGTLLGTTSTFWVEEYNNLLFNSSGVAQAWHPDDFIGSGSGGGNYLGINRMYFDKSNSKENKNLALSNSFLSGSDATKMAKFTNNS